MLTADCQFIISYFYWKLISSVKTDRNTDSEKRKSSRTVELFSAPSLITNTWKETPYSIIHLKSLARLAHPASQWTRASAASSLRHFLKTPCLSIHQTLHAFAYRFLIQLSPLSPFFFTFHPAFFSQPPRVLIHRSRVLPTFYTFFPPLAATPSCNFSTARCRLRGTQRKSAACLRWRRPPLLLPPPQQPPLLKLWIRCR